jgi:hypothetical protein
LLNGLISCPELILALLGLIFKLGAIGLQMRDPGLLGLNFMLETLNYAIRLQKFLLKVTFDAAQVLYLSDEILRFLHQMFRK